MKVKIVKIPNQYKYGGELNSAKWHDDGGPLSNEEFYNIMEKVAKENYKRWRFNNPDEAFVNVLNNNTYDYRGYYNKYPSSDANSLTHWTDEFKTVYHPTFSNESRYSGKKSKFNPKGLVGGFWIYPRGKEVFIPAPWQRKKAEGGPLHTQGGIWDNGLTYINAGGSHEENPMGGTRMGMDSQGVPNLVEEGEIVWNDYVFSNRLKVPKKTREQLKLGNSEITFADAAKRLGKESEERPNDPISQRGLTDFMLKLQQSQEEIRQIKANKGESRRYAYGGKKVNKFDGLKSDTMFLNGVNYGDWQNYGTLLAPIKGEDIMKEALKNSKGPGTKDGNNKLSLLRYAPVLGAAIGLGQNLFSKPDYSDYNTLMQEAQNAGSYTPIRPTLINDYLTYNPIDRAWATNKLNAQASAGRRAIVNQSAGNRATALAGLVASNYNTQQGLGDLLLNADMYNNQQRERVATFNRATNQTNADLGLRAAMANQEAALKSRGLRLEGINKAIAMRNAIDSARAASMSANLTNLFDSLGNIGREEFAKQMVRGNKSLLYDWFGRYKDQILDDLKTT